MILLAVLLMSVSRVFLVDRQRVEHIVVTFPTGAQVEA